MRISLGVLLAFCLAGLQFLAVLLVVFSSYVSSERALINHARDLLRDVGVNTIEHSRGFLNPARGAAELAARLAQNRVVASDDTHQLEQLLFQQLQITPQFAGVYYGNEDGTFVYVMRSPDGPAPFRSKIISMANGVRSTELIWRTDGFAVVRRESDPLDTYDPRSRPWYMMARADLTTIWTDPYIFFSSQQPGITLAAPVLRDGGGVRGVVGVDIEISMISNFLSRLKIGSTGKALILHKNGDVIAHPQLELIKARNDDGTLRFVNIREFGDPIAQAAFAPLLSNGEVMVEQETPSQFVYDGATYVSNVLPVSSDVLPWTIAVYAPEDDFTAAIKQNRSANIWIAALVALLTGVFGLVLADYIHRPVRAFAIRSSLIAQGEIAPDAKAPRTYKELEKANSTLVQQIVARREAESEYGQTFELSDRAMAQISTRDGTVIRANAKFAEMVGATIEQVSGHGLDAVAHPEDLATYTCATEDLTVPPPVNTEMRWHRTNGEQIWVRMNMLVIRDNQGRPLHGVLTVDDITEEHARGVQISQLSRDLAHLARGNTMGQMASGLAHELNQPLTAIAQNAGTALLTLEEMPETDPELIEIVGEIERQSLRAGEIIRALRGFIKKDEGARQAFDFQELLVQTMHLVHAEAVDARVRISSDLEPLPQVFGIRIQIAQVLVNLLRNAIEAISQSGRSERQVTVTARPEAEGVLVSVADTGPGLSPGINLFTQFETTKPEGMGLGLSICRTIIESNGGRIWHETNAAGGASFFFILLAAPAAATGEADT